MTSPHFIQQYFTSFCEDPVLKSLEKVGPASNFIHTKMNSIYYPRRLKATLMSKRESRAILLPDSVSGEARAGLS